MLEDAMASINHPGDELLTAAILTAALDCIITSDQYGQVIEWNPAAERTFGYTRQEAIGRTLSDLIIPPAYRDAHQRGLQRYLATGEARIVNQRLQLEALRRDGSLFPCELAIHPVQANGRTYFTAYLRDISEQVRTEAALREREAHYRALVEHAAVGVARVDLQGRWLEVNPALEQFLGYTQQELQGMTFRDVTHPDDLGEAGTRPFRRLVADEIESFTLEKRYVRKDGLTVWASLTLSAVRDADGKTLYCAAIIKDTTQRQQAEAELRESQARLRFALDAAELGDWVLDLRDHSSWRSRRHDAIFGYPDGHLTWTYETFLEHVLPEDREEVDRKFRVAVEQSEPWDVECRVRRADGEERWIWTRARVLQDQDGTETHMLGIVGDITDFKRSEAQVRSLNATLEERVEERTLDLETQRASLDAFVAFTEAVGGETDKLALVRQALAVLQTRFSDPSATYYEPEGELWKAREWTSDIRDDTLAIIRAGLPAETPLIAQTLHSRRAEFVDAWNAQRERVDRTDQYGSIATYPLIVDDEVIGLLAVGLKDTRQWSERDKSLVRAVGRSLNLALERAHHSAQLAIQNAELAARTKALEGFASLTRDLTLKSDPVALVQRAQEVVMSTLPEGHAAYYQLEGTVWRLRSMVGDWGNPALQATVETGIPYEGTRNFMVPWTTGRPHYQDVYDPSTDNLGELVQHFAASSVLPVMVNGEPVGVMAVALFHQRRWTSTDKAVLESVVRHLGLALEGASSLAQLAERTRELERSNRDLEQFAYVASHDLQEPLRTVISYSELLAKRYQGQLDEKADQYIRFTVNAATRMRSLVRDLLTFSRVRAENQHLSTVDPNEVLDSVLHDLGETIRQSGATVTNDQLPAVQADPLQLRQLLQNLVGNAIKFRREDVAPTVHVSAQEEGDAHHFQVQDNGIGIEEAYFERIFTVFQRLHSREKYEGTGVGLAVCKRIVERHGGQMWVDSRPGEGSTFHFTLPADKNTTGRLEDHSG